MQAKIAKRTDSQVTIQVQLDSGQLTPLVKLAFEHLRPKVKAAGFRAGKAPDHIVERELGHDAVQSEVLEHAIAQSYGQAVKDLEIAAIAAPKVQLKKFVPFTELEYAAEIPVLPPVKLPDLRKIKLKRPVVQITATDIDQVINDLRRRLAKRTIADRPAGPGDEVVIDFEGKKDGQPVPGASGSNYSLELGSGRFIPGFEQRLESMKAGGEKTFLIKFPDDYSSPGLAGQEVEFSVKLQQVNQVELPAADDQFAGQVGPFGDLAALKADIQNQLEAEKRAELDRQFENQAVEKVVEAAKVKVPDELVHQQLETLRAELQSNLAYQGLDLEKYSQMSGKSPQQIDDELRPQAEKRVAGAIVLTEYAKQEGLKVDETEIHAELERIQAAYPDLASKSQREKHDLHNEVYNHLLSRKVIAKIQEQIEEK